jgi:hypothetical protein
MGGRHGRTRRRRGFAARRTAAVVAAVVLGGLVVVGGVALSRGAVAGADPTGAQAADASRAPESRADVSPVVGSGPAVDEVTADGTPAALADCVRAVERGERVVLAAGTVHGNWSGHVRAQLDYDAGTATLEQTRERWAATKATADADLLAFTTAVVEYRPGAAACAALRAADLPERWQQPAVQCQVRDAGLATAVGAGEAVVGDWAAHVAMMKDKSHTEPTQYGRMWDEMVAAAPPNIAAFGTARDALTGVPGCAVAL